MAAGGQVTLLFIRYYRSNRGAEKSQGTHRMPDTHFCVTKSDSHARQSCCSDFAMRFFFVYLRWLILITSFSRVFRVFTSRTFPKRPVVLKVQKVSNLVQYSALFFLCCELVKDTRTIVTFFCTAIKMSKNNEGWKFNCIDWMLLLGLYVRWNHRSWSSELWNQSCTQHKVSALLCQAPLNDNTLKPDIPVHYEFRRITCCNSNCASSQMLILMSFE